MRVKPKPKTCYSRRCVIYDIETGTRSETPSITKAAAKIGCSTSFLGKIIRAGMNTNGYVVAYIEDEQKALVKLRALQAKGDYKPRKQRRREEKLVPLRIDSRTTIYVKPENATEAYAEQWRQRYYECNPRKKGGEQ
jgi:hypothetical protein